jgi:very-short-patch-repair endonuclease
MPQHPQPFDLEDLLAAAVEALKIQGDARAIAALLEGTCQLSLWNSDFGVDFWRLFVALPVPLFYALDEDERKATQTTIAAAVSPLFSSLSGDSLEEVAITPLVAQAKAGWRDEAVRFIKGEGVTNQGRVRSDNIASKQHQGLLFRSKAEITLFQALIKAKLAVAPLPVFVRVGKSYNRLEPDFVVVYKGLTFVVEVDGDTFHRESPAEAERRLVPLTYEGVEVRRIRAEDLSSDAAAETAVRELIEFMAKRKEAR